MHRRKVLTVAGALTAAGLGGCLGGDDSGDNGNTSADDDESGDGNPGDGSPGDGDGGPDDGDGGPGPSGEVEASFTAEPTEVTAGESITLDASASTGEIARYVWEFSDDGTTLGTSEPTLTRTFDRPGTHTVTLEVRSVGGALTDETSAEVTVAEQPEDDPAILIDFEVQTDDPQPGDEVRFGAVELAGNEASIETFRWDFDDDGEFEETGAIATYTFADAGAKRVTLQAEDTEGRTASATRFVPVGVENEDAFAAFAFDPPEARVGDTVTFDASDSEGNIVEYRWDFDGDGTTDETTGETVVTRSFDEVGERSVTLEVETPTGVVDTTTEDVPVLPAEQPLEVVFSVRPDTPDVGEEVTFDAGFSNGDIVEYRWDFGSDGTVDETTDGPVTTRSFDEEGSVSVRLVAEDTDGETDDAFRVFTVGGDSVEPAFEWTPEEPAVGAEITFDASATTGEVTEYRWDFDSDGTVDQSGTDPVATHSFDTPGTRGVLLEVVDELGDIYTVTRAVSVGSE